ncbi:MAG: Glycosyltransferase [Marinobacter excellens HL-55]|uniref:Glycosyltransferase n=1 Tax=Marinobacter excellens HL-55 TaxID=1305731 RepID=A0A0P7Z7A0_9GAMM|nr:MAG: Glycosyltransferase [Marinobacter excellens HL-55]
MRNIKLWVTWEDHRRSRELSKAFGAEYMPIIYSGTKIFRYPTLMVSTILKASIARPKIVFCQNPSIVLATILTLMKVIFGFKLIVDRHSNFKFEHQYSKKLKWRLFWFLSRYTVRSADLTIVTNDDLMNICEKWGGRAKVLPDKIPDMSANEAYESNLKLDSKKINVMAVTTFDSDEPIDEMLGAAEIVGDNYVLYMTGNSNKYFCKKNSNFDVPDNVVLTGFISEVDYRSLMNSVDVVVVLTKKDLILNCGGYEAVSVNVPLVLSNTRTLREYFCDAPVFVNVDRISIAAGIVEAYSRRESIRKEMLVLKEDLCDAWREKFNDINKLVMNF